MKIVYKQVHKAATKQNLKAIKLKVRYLLKIALLLILTACLTIAIPVLAQQTTVELPEFYFNDKPLFTPFKPKENSAFVVLDGRQLFTVGNFIDQEKYLSASKRAEDISNKIKDAVNLSTSPELEVQNINGSPTIFLNGNHLFTITSKEVINNENAFQKALELKDKIELSIIQAQQERSNNYRYRQYILIVLIIIIVLVINRLLTLLKYHRFKKAISLLIPFNKVRSSESAKKANFLTRLQLNTAKLLLLLIGIYLITDLFPVTRRLRYGILQRLWNAINAPLFSLGNNQYSIISVFILIGLFWGLLYVISTVTNLLKSSILHRTGMSRGSQEVIFIITKYALLAVGTIILLQVWGLNLSSLTILGSALGVGIGFGFQDIAKNFASGLVLLFERSVQVGDFIEVNEYQGTVEKVGARSIVLTTLDRVSIIVPNSSLLADEVVNWTYKNSISRLHLPVGVAYGSDTGVVKSVLLEAAKENLKVLVNPAPQVLFEGFGDSSLNFQLLVWIAEPSHQAFIKSDLYFQIETLLRKHSIEIPFPQRDIAIRNSNLSLGLPQDLENALLQWLKTITKS